MTTLRAVGDPDVTLEVPADQLEMLRSAEATLRARQAELGALREQYLTQEEALTRAVSRQRQEFTVLANAIAKKAGLADVSGWTLDLPAGVLRQVG